MIQGAIFDVDGTILDSMPVWENLGERYLAGLGVEAGPGLTEKLNTMSTRQAAQYLIESYGLGISVPQAMVGINHLLYEFYSKHVSLKTGVKDCLDMLERQGIPMIVATSGDRENVEAAFRRLNILCYFQEILTCSEMNTDKTEAKIYLAASHKMNAIPERTIVFEDAPHALETAKRAGFITAAVYDHSVKETKEKMKETADYYLKTFVGVRYQILELL